MKTIFRPKSYLFTLLLMAFLLPTVFSQTTIINYQIPLQGTGSCFLNLSPGPNSPKLIGGINHYAIAGGVDNTGSEIVLNGNNTGGATSYGIWYPFDQNYKYKIVINTLASSSTMKLFFSTSDARCAISSSCSPAFFAIFCGSGFQSSITNMSSTYNSYTLLDNYTPNQTGLNYFLLGGANSVASLGSIKIKSLTITKTPLCKPPIISSAVGIGQRQIKVFFTPPAFNTAVNGYSVIAQKAGSFINMGGTPVYVPGETYGFPNAGSSSPIIITLPSNASLGNYTIILRSNCNSGTEYANSNGVSVNVF